jgi:hypothetical protein
MEIAKYKLSSILKILNVLIAKMQKEVKKRFR